MCAVETVWGCDRAAAGRLDSRHWVHGDCLHPAWRRGRRASDQSADHQWAPHTHSYTHVHASMHTHTQTFFSFTQAKRSIKTSRVNWFPHTSSGKEKQEHKPSSCLYLLSPVFLYLPIFSSAAEFSQQPPVLWYHTQLGPHQLGTCCA